MDKLHFFFKLTWVEGLSVIYLFCNFLRNLEYFKFIIRWKKKIQLHAFRNPAHFSTFFAIWLLNSITVAVNCTKKRFISMCWCWCIFHSYSFIVSNTFALFNYSSHLIPSREELITFVEYIDILLTYSVFPLMNLFSNMRWFRAYLSISLK